MRNVFESLGKMRGILFYALSFLRGGMYVVTLTALAAYALCGFSFVTLHADFEELMREYTGYFAGFSTSNYLTYCAIFVLLMLLMGFFFSKGRPPAISEEHVFLFAGAFLATIITPMVMSEPWKNGFGILKGSTGVTCVFFWLMGFVFINLLTRDLKEMIPCPVRNEERDAL